MDTIPLNRYILIEPAADEEPEEAAAILMPDNYKPKSPYIKAEVIRSAADSKILIGAGDHVIVDSSMVEEISLEGETIHLILENHILCVLEED